MSPRALRLRVRQEEDGRLDRFLTAKLDAWTRSAIRHLIDDGQVFVDGVAATKAGLAVVPGATVEVVLPDPALEFPGGENIPIAVVHEDDDIVVVDKQAGLVVHPGHGHPDGTLVNALIGRGTPLAPAGGRDRPGIVHRLDMDTSGLLVVAKTDPAYRGLAEAFAERRVRKRYHAVVWGHPNPPDGVIARRVGRSRRHRTRMTTGGIAARHAETRYATVEVMPGFSVLEIDLRTGRTHQIRVHLQSIHHPVVGDERYGGRMWRGVRDPIRKKALREFGRHALHASDLALSHPVSGEPLEYHSPLPPDIAALLEVLRRP